jgi:amidohydrolase
MSYEVLNEEKLAPSSTAGPIRVISEVYDLFDDMVAWRRHFHAFPELSFQEFKTAAKVVELLLSFGIDKSDIIEEVGKTGVVAMIKGGAGDGPCVMLRADMDALPLMETAAIEYKSQNEGVMHACGHDGHMSALLGAAKVLHLQRATMRGSIKLCFQPAEEGKNGAVPMMKDGLLDGTNKCAATPRVDFVYGIHLWSYARLGTVQCSEGPVMAASDKFTVNIKGKGGHGAVPEGTVDAIVSAGTVINSFHSIVSRNVGPLQTGVVTIGTIKGGSGYNIIADKVEMTGTARSFDPAVQELMKGRMEDICCGVGKMSGGGEAELQYDYGYPPTVNAYPEEVARVRASAAKVLDPDRVNHTQKTMGAEDFSFFLQERPGVFFFVGAAHPGEIRPHHKSVFDFDERALLVSASCFVQLIRDMLC